MKLRYHIKPHIQASKGAREPCEKKLSLRSQISHGLKKMIQ